MAEGFLGLILELLGVAGDAYNDRAEKQYRDMVRMKRSKAYDEMSYEEQEKFDEKLERFRERLEASREKTESYKGRISSQDSDEY